MSTTEGGGRDPQGLESLTRALAEAQATVRTLEAERQAMEQKHRVMEAVRQAMEQQLQELEHQLKCLVRL